MLAPARSLDRARSSRTNRDRWIRQPGNAALLLVCLAWSALLGRILQFRIFVTNDSLSNYAHVWYISDRLWHAHTIPLRMPLLGHGRAFAFPYAFLPWLSAAVFRPLVGDWIVTLWLVLGFVGAAAATLWAFPELRGGWWSAAVLVNPVLVEAPLLGQLPFLWAIAFLLLAIGCWRRERSWWAVVLAGLAQATHPAVLMPIVAALALGWLPFERRKLRFLALAACSAVIAAPAVAVVLASPVVEDSSWGTVIGNFAGTVAPRAWVVGIPLLLVGVRRRGWAWAPVAMWEALLMLNAGVMPFAHTRYGWLALTRKPDEAILPFVASDSFTPGATYRILRAYDGKIGMYQLIQHGARLDSELFPESIARRSWPSADAYAAFLRARRVDYVIVFQNYDFRYRTNEHRLLDRLAAGAPPRAGPGLPCVALSARTPAYDVYAIRWPPAAASC